MNINLIKFSELDASKWKNGITYQYYIFPNNANYQNKDFLFRISSATIDNIPSEFTNFIGYYRYLAMLDNNLDLKINNREVHLEPNQLIEFKSEDSVVSYSKGNDFNLMIKEDIQDYNIVIDKGFFVLKDDFIILYALNNSTIHVNNNQYILEQKDCLVIENIENESFDLICSNNLIISRINLVHHSFF